MTDEPYVLKEVDNEGIDRKEPVTKVIVRGPTLVGDSNRAHKNYKKYSITNQKVFLNLSLAKPVKLK